MTPGGAAIGRLENASLSVWAKGMTKGRDPHCIRIVWVNTNLPDEACVGKSEMGPAMPRIGAAIDTVTMCDVDANRGFTRARVDNVRI